MSLEYIMFQETRQTQEDKCHMISLTYGILKRKKRLDRWKSWKVTIIKDREMKG